VNYFFASKSPLYVHWIIASTYSQFEYHIRMAWHGMAFSWIMLIIILMIVNQFRLLTGQEINFEPFKRDWYIIVTGYSFRPICSFYKDLGSNFRFLFAARVCIIYIYIQQVHKLNLETGIFFSTECFKYLCLVKYISDVFISSF